MGPTNVPQEIKKLYKIIPLRELRRTPGVNFDYLSSKELPKIDGIDRVIHTVGAVSPGPVGEVERPWYMHPHQADNLMVLHGKRFVDIYTKEHGKLVSVVVTPDRIEIDGELAYDGPAMLVWPTNVFHRIRSCPELGSASVNFAVRGEGFNIRTNFNIYDLNLETGEYKVIREGHLDQPSTLE
ncbi:MAG: hypothetical protein Kow0029_30390 [Candidatus Rifleibacteriota bacterium]